MVPFFLLNFSQIPLTPPQNPTLIFYLGNALTNWFSVFSSPLFLTPCLAMFFPLTLLGIYGPLLLQCSPLTHRQKNFSFAFNWPTYLKVTNQSWTTLVRFAPLWTSIAATSIPLPDKEVVTYLLNGIGLSYEGFITPVTPRVKPISSHELFQLLLIHESRSAHQHRTLIFTIEPSG